MSSKSLLDFLNESPALTHHKSHRRTASDPFGSTHAPMSDADVAEFLAGGDDGGDAFMPGSLFSLPSFREDDDFDVADLLAPTPPGVGAPAFWPSPRTPGRKHRRTISEPTNGFFVPAADVRHAAPARRAPHPLLADDDDDDDLDGLDAFPLDIADDAGALDLGRAPAPFRMPPPPPPPPSGPPPPDAGESRRRKPRARPAEPSSDEKKQKKYRCSRCGQIKANHVCPFVVNDAIAVATQADPAAVVLSAGCATLACRPRSIAAA